MSTANWFIGLPMPAEDLPVDCLSDLPPGLRRFHEDDLHVTVAFLGDVGEIRAMSAWRVAEALPFRGFRVRVRARRALGNPRRPSAYGLEVDDDAASLATFIGEHRNALRAAADLPPESRPPLPHVTLGRPPRRAGEAIRRRAATWLTEPAPPSATEIRLDRLALYTRTAGREVRRFRRVAERRAEIGSGRRGSPDQGP